MNSFFSYKADGISTNTDDVWKLIIEIGKCHISYLICDEQKDKVHEFQIWSTTKNIDTESIDFLINDLNSKNKNFKSVHLVLNNGISTLMPISHFRTGHTQEILNLLFTDIEERTNFEHEISGWDVVSLFGVNTTVFNLLNAKFNLASIIPACAGYFKEHNFSFVSGSQVIRVFFYPSSMTIMVTKDRNLMLLQEHDYQSLDDIAYHLIQVCTQLELDRETALLRLSGAISEDSAMFKELFKLFRNVELELPQVNYLIDDIEETLHYFTPSFLTLECV